MRSQLRAVSLRMGTAKSVEAMTSMLQGTTTAMKAMASTMNLPRLNQIVIDQREQEDGDDAGDSGRHHRRRHGRR
ncbi:Charged multivesicular body protein 2a [Phytophthora cinnamomi]|uniref:Charged multivesicular body protein 2a n=1 Tax=Phytophthora cinnamomi TaxID=4785 RepID=UPI00355A16BB|nr:Charged multivesicular body protein 2a [Phytophthora cinnamomi]